MICTYCNCIQPIKCVLHCKHPETTCQRGAEDFHSKQMIFEEENSQPLGSNGGKGLEVFLPRRPPGNYSNELSSKLIKAMVYPARVVLTSNMFLVYGFVFVFFSTLGDPQI